MHICKYTCTTHGLCEAPCQRCWQTSTACGVSLRLCASSVGMQKYIKYQLVAVNHTHIITIIIHSFLYNICQSIYDPRYIYISLYICIYTCITNGLCEAPCQRCWQTSTTCGVSLRLCASSVGMQKYLN